MIDCISFLGLVIIIIFSFSNFFYVINSNLIDESNGQRTYISPYTSDNVLLDSILNTYFMCIGVYDVNILGQGKDEYFVLIMWLFGTFINLIVFMNMLIAIMA